jgi:Transposase
MAVVEAVNGNIKALLRRGRGYRDMNYLLLKAQRLARHKDRIRRFSESRVECALLQIVVQNPLLGNAASRSGKCSGVFTPVHIRCPRGMAGR